MVCKTLLQSGANYFSFVLKSVLLKKKRVLLIDLIDIWQSSGIFEIIHFQQDKVLTKAVARSYK